MLMLIMLLMNCNKTVHNCNCILCILSPSEILITSDLNTCCCLADKSWCSIDLVTFLDVVHSWGSMLNPTFSHLLLHLVVTYGCNQASWPLDLIVVEAVNNVVLVHQNLRSWATPGVIISPDFMAITVHFHLSHHYLHYRDLVCWEKTRGKSRTRRRCWLEEKQTKLERRKQIRQMRAARIQ